MRKQIVVACAAGWLGLVLGASPAPAQSLPPNTWAGSPGASWDAMSWQTFAQAVTPAGTQVMFETWATDGDTYTDKPTWPTAATVGHALAIAPHKARFHGSSLARALATSSLQPSDTAQGIGSSCVAPADPGAGNFPLQGGCIAEEVRRNRPSFDYIVGNGLNTQAGLLQNLANGQPIEFPWAAVELKADWVPVPILIHWMANNGVSLSPADVMNLYYTTKDGQGQLYAMVAMHLSSKVLPNWLWATFEHQLNPGRCDTMGCYDEFGAIVKSVAPADTNRQYGACAKSGALLSLFASLKLSPVWNNYCLKESETAFTGGPSNAPILDGNSVIERINAGVPIARSSCISCHAAAAFNNQAQSNGVGGLDLNPIGNYVMPTGFKAYDFVWGLINIAPPTTAAARSR